MPAQFGLGEPRGPSFVSPPRTPPPVAPPPPLPTPAIPAGAEQASRPNRVLVVAVLAAALAGGIAGIAGASLIGEESTAAAPPLPQSTLGPSNGAADLSDVAARLQPSVVSVEVAQGSGRGGTGSGFVIDQRGHILTNDHVVEDADDVRVVLHDRRRLSAQIAGRDPATDLAVLTIDPPRNLPAVTLGRSADVRVADPVLAIGSPLRFAGTVTSGIVSAVNREIPVGTGGLQTALQTDASINKGNSGGPLVNARGEVIGVNTEIATLSGGSGSIGIGFAIPVDRAADVAHRIIRN